MSLQLRLHTAPEVPLEASVLSPDKLAGLDSGKVSSQQVHHGNQPATVGDFFKVSGQDSDEIHIEGDLSLIKHIGAGMSRGRLIIDGPVGSHIGAGMIGGEITVNGNAADWVGPEMAGGRIIIKGDCGHMVGSVYRGGSVGMRDGEIIVHGKVGNETGNAMRGGFIVIGGNSGDFTGVNMLAGTIMVLGEMGIRTGAGMKRGSIISMREAQMLPTFTYTCTYQPLYLRFYLIHLQDQGLDVDEGCFKGRYQRWMGDSVELNRGEVLLLDG